MKNVNEKEATQTTVAKINNVEIIVIENGEKKLPLNQFARLWELMLIAKGRS